MSESNAVSVSDDVFMADERVREIAAHLVAVKPTLRPGDIASGSSLTEDLGFDSLDLVTLAGRIRDTYPAFDLKAWLASAMQTQVDSVGSMAAMLAESPHA